MVLGACLAHTRARIVLPRRQNFAAAYGFQGRAKPPATNDSAFYHPRHHCLQVFRGTSRMPRAVNRSRAGAFYKLALRRRRSCAVQKGNVLAINEGVLTLKKSREGSPSIGKGASDGTHSHNHRHHGDHVVRLSRRRHPRDDLEARSLKAPKRLLFSFSLTAFPGGHHRLGFCAFWRDSPPQPAHSAASAIRFGS